jgi:hypothetical protein
MSFSARPDLPDYRDLHRYTADFIWNIDIAFRRFTEIHFDGVAATNASDADADDLRDSFEVTVGCRFGGPCLLERYTCHFLPQGATRIVTQTR